MEIFGILGSNAKFHFYTTYDSKETIECVILICNNVDGDVLYFNVHGYNKNIKIEPSWEQKIIFP